MNINGTKLDMLWTRRRLIFDPTGRDSWMRSHAQVPTVLVLPTCFRVYFAARPNQQTSLTTFVDLDLDDPTKILAIRSEPILHVGPPGAFDEHGIMPQCAIRWNGRIHLYYVGWSRRVSIPYSNWVGLALSDDDGVTFTKHADTPVLDRAPGDFLSATGLTCIEHQNRLHGWYASGMPWAEVDGVQESLYQIRSCGSTDGITWHRDSMQVISPLHPLEANTRPAVLHHDGRWHMWFCHRGVEDFRDGRDAYRIGYAWSSDLLTWTRDDAAGGLAPEGTGWDSTMTAYPCVVKQGDRILMFYNGNGFGRNGFGYAVLEP